MRTMRLGSHTIRTPAVCASISGTDEGEIRKGIKLAKGADLLEIRLDLAKRGMALEEVMPDGIPVILTNRPKREGGGYAGSEDERVALLIRSMDLSPSCIDIELSTPKNLMEEVLTEAKRRNISVIVSHHDFSGTPKLELLEDALRKARGAGGDIIKIVTMARSRGDAMRMLEFLVRAQGEPGTPLISFAMGEEGKITRYIGPVLGCPWMYAGVIEKTAPGQPDLSTAVRWIKYLRKLEVR